MWSRLGAVTALTVGLMALSVPLAAHAQDPVDLDGAYVLDTVGAITGDESRVLAALDSSYESSGIQLFVVYVDAFTAATDPIQWADETADKNSLGVNDVLLAVALDDRLYGLSVDPNVALDESQITNVELAIEAELRDDRWADAAIAGAAALALEAAGGEVVVDPPAEQPSEPSSGGGIPILPIVGGAALVGAGVFIYSRIRRRGKDGTTTSVPGAMTLKQLDTRAGSLLVQLDDSLKTSEQELGFAVAQFGEAATADFTKVLVSAKAKVAAAFAIRQKLDDHNPETEADKRALTTEIIQLCEAADAELDSQADAFDDLRELEKNAPDALAKVTTQRAEILARAAAAKSTLSKLGGIYAASALASVSTNVEQAQKLLTFADTAISSATGFISASKNADAAIAVRTAQASVGQAAELFDAIDRLASSLDDAATKLKSAVTDTTADITAARALPADAALAPAIEAAAAALAVADRGADDPLASLTQVEQANAALEKVFVNVRDAQEKIAAARSQLDPSLAAARAQIASAKEFITTRRGGIGESARTRVAEADRLLAQAEAVASSDPIAALAQAQRASELAASAFELASRDVASFNSQQTTTRSSGGYDGADLGGLLGGLVGGLLSGGSSSSGSSGGWSGGGSSSRRPSSSSRSGSFGGSSRSASRSSGGRSSRGGRF